MRYIPSRLICTALVAGYFVLAYVGQVLGCLYEAGKDCGYSLREIWTGEFE